MKLDVPLADQGLVIHFGAEAVDNLDVGVGEGRELVFLGAREEAYVTSGDGASYYDNSLDVAVLQELESSRYPRIRFRRSGHTGKKKTWRFRFQDSLLARSKVRVETKRHRRDGLHSAQLHVDTPSKGKFRLTRSPSQTS